MNTDEQNTQPLRLTGRVKWFNDKAGFGFITVCDEGPHKDADIFVHYSSINGESSQYKYLVQGEYVEFDLEKSTNEKHEHHAKNITGIKGGILMCETHRLNSVSKHRFENGQNASKPVNVERQATRKSNTSSRRSDDLNEKNDGFVQVRRKRVKPSSS